MGLKSHGHDLRPHPPWTLPLLCAAPRGSAVLLSSATHLLLQETFAAPTKAPPKPLSRASQAPADAASAPLSRLHGSYRPHRLVLCPTQNDGWHGRLVCPCCLLFRVHWRASRQPATARRGEPGCHPPFQWGQSTSPVLEDRLYPFQRLHWPRWETAHPQRPIIHVMLHWACRAGWRGIRRCLGGFEAVWASARALRFLGAPGDRRCADSSGCAKHRKCERARKAIAGESVVRRGPLLVGVEKVLVGDL